MSFGPFLKLTKNTAICFFCAFFLLFITAGQALSAPVKIGVYENKPLVYLDAQGEYQGFTIDVLRYVAKQEGWQLQFVPGTWTECLQRLESGEIDLQVAIAISEQRKKLYSYPEKTLITNWGRLYRHPQEDVDSLLDLGGKKIALLKKDIHAKVFFELMEKFNLQVEAVFVESYDAVLKMVESGQVSAGVINRMYAMQNAHLFEVKITGMIFNPLEVRYAAPKGKNAQLLQALDHHIEQLRLDKNSIYYTSLEKCFGQANIAKIPTWVRTTALTATALFLLFFAASMLLKRQVNIKTAELVQVNQLLSAQVTELKTAKQALRESEEKFRTLLNNQSDAVFLHPLVEDGYANFSMVNEVAVERYGYSLEEFQQLSAADITPKEELSKHSAGARQKLIEQGCAVFELMHRKKSGEEIPVEASAKIIEMDGGKYILSTVRDISERKAAEQKIIESEKKYRTLLNHQNDAVFLHRFRTDGFSRFIEVNDGAVARYGYSRKELLQLGPAEIDAPEVQTQERFMAIRADLRQQRHAVFESLHIDKAGKRFPVEINATLIELQGKEYILAAARDITERKNAEREQQLSNERFTTVLNSIDAGIYVADMETYEILFMNQFMIDDFGHDYTGQICWEAFRNEPRICEHYNNELLVDENGEPTGMKVWQADNPQTGKHYMNYDRAIRWIDGRIVRLQISTDITEIKTLEAQLRQKYKMEAVGLMAGGIAHDFNNVLAIIMTNLELMHRKMAADDPQLPRLEQARSASLRASDLVKQILTYSRQGEQSLKPVKLAFIIEESLKLLRSTTPASIELLTRIEPSARAERVHADSIQLEEVLINLCTNAVHAMGEKGLLTVSLSKLHLKNSNLPISNRNQPGEYLKLTVEDTGAGMAPEVIEKIFDPFYTTKPAGQGTGMGLAISHGIIKKHGGYFQVESTLEKGSTFSVFLPIVESMQTPLPEKTNLDLPRGDEKILLVDDEKLLADSMAEFLTEQGYRVKIETDSIKALERLQTEAFDLIVSDQTMPELTGLELATKVLQNKPQQAIILCSGYSASLTEENALAAGIKAVFSKPLNLTELTRTIRTLLDERTSEKLP